MNTDTVVVDVREDIRNGREPFSKIMNTAKALGKGQELVLLAPFEPVPLFEVLAKQGFQYNAEQHQSGEWQVRFVRTGQIQPAAKEATQIGENRGPASAQAPTEVVEVDARGLEPPLPMIKILETLSSLRAPAELRARTDRRPIHLYAQLEERGFGSRTEEQPDGSFLTHIFRR